MSHVYGGLPANPTFTTLTVTGAATFASTVTVTTSLGTTGSRVPVIYLGGNTPAASAPMLDLSQTWNAAVNFIGVDWTFVDTLSGAAALPFRIRGGAAGTDVLFRMDKGGSITISGIVDAYACVVSGAGSYAFGAYGGLSSTGDGIIVLKDNAGTSFGRLCFGGVTSAFPSWKRSSNVFHARLADDSDYAGLTVKDFQFTGRVYDSSANAVLGPQGAAVADATGGAIIDVECRAALNALLARDRAHGLIAT